jgi:hypothetical protein
MLLAGDDPRLKALRRQLAGSRVRSREFTGVGFFTNLTVPPDATRAPVGAQRVTLGDVAASMNGLAHGAGFVLFITDGMLDFLEGFTYDEPWPEIIGAFSLRYWNEDRDLAELGSLTRPDSSGS